MSAFNDTQVKELAHWQAVAFRLPATQMEKGCGWTTLPCLGVLGWKDYMPLKEFQGVWDYQVVQREEMVALAMALQRYAFWSGMLLGVLCKAVQELHRCITPLVKQGDLLDLDMLDVAKNDPVAPPVPAKGASSAGARAEEPIGVPVPDKHLLWSQGGCSLRRIGPCAEEKITSTPCVYPFMGRQV